MINTSLLKAAFYKPSSENASVPVLPANTLTKQHQINARHCEQYNQLVNWKLGIASVIHPNYLQVLTLPMQLQMMTTQPFPFKAMGLVHLANTIRVNRLPEQNASITLKTSFAGLKWHKKGWVFALLNEGIVDGEIAVSALSFYLSRQKHVSDEQVMTSSAHVSDIQMPNYDSSIEGVSLNETLLFPPDIGRKYAKVSGDFNPIHLARWSAKLMGFKQAIAHGMYSKALCLSLLLKQQQASGAISPSQASLDISTQFMQPIYLPTSGELQVAYRSAKDIKYGNASNASIAAQDAQLIECSLISKYRMKKREHLRTQIIMS